VDTRIRKPEKMESVKNEGTAIKPKTSVPFEETDEIDTRDQFEQDRVTEKLSMSVPAPRLPKLNPPLGMFLNQPVRLQLRDGNVITGILRGTQGDFLRLDQVKETCQEHIITATWCAVRTDSVARVYPGSAVVEKV